MEQRRDYVGTRVWSAVAAVMLLAPAVATAQFSADSFERAAQALKPGQRVVITDVAGGDAKGRVVDATPASITLTMSNGAIDERRSFARARVATIRRSDSLWNGLLIGAGVGIVATEVWARQTCGNDGECAAITRLVGWGALAGGGAAVGALFDRFTGNNVIYRAGASSTIRVTPLVGRRTTGLSVSLEF